VSTPTERFAQGLDPDVTAAVRRASALKVQDRQRRLTSVFPDIDAARSQAAAIKDEILADLEGHLRAFETRAMANGITVHHAVTAEDARDIILSICATQPGPIVKGKSMATEEIHLNQALEEAGFEVTETDLGEYVVQIDGDTPSHIVTPIIHKDRRQIAHSFKRKGLGDYTEDPATLAGQARTHLRQRFKEATVGISGVNFALVDTGQLVIVENEGNNRLSTTMPRVHIAVMGIEKLLPRTEDLPLFLRLLAGSATGQAVTTYTHFITGPAPDGPEEVHLVLLDAGRRDIVNSRYRAILRCIRCGACLNACPVYRQVSGHGYGHVYPGPIGAVLAPLLEKKSGRLKELPKASTLCGACEEVCPVKIPIPEMLLHLRSDAGEPGSWAAFAMMATNPTRWSAAKASARIGPALGWIDQREGPSPDGQSFRSWWASRVPDRPTRFKDAEPAALIHDPVEPAPSLWDQFENALTALGGQVIHHPGPRPTTDELQNLISADLFADARVAGRGLETPTDDIWEATLGITEADLAIAETGTLILRSEPRPLSLVPPIHIALIPRDRIRPRLEDAVATSKEGNTVWVTGPSRTADIEGVLVRGVHGPGEVIVVTYDP